MVGLGSSQVVNQDAKTIGEGLEVLAGAEAGEARADGAFPEGTVNHLIADRLDELNDSMRGYYQGMASNKK